MKTIKSHTHNYKKNQLFFVIMFVFFINLLSSPKLFAQIPMQSSFKKTTATILFSSIGGGILGLSTLSFYGKPQEHTDNITTGVLLGFLLGTSYVVYQNYQGQNARYSQQENSHSDISKSLAAWENMTHLDNLKRYEKNKMSINLVNLSLLF